MLKRNNLKLFFRLSNGEKSKAAFQDESETARDFVRDIAEQYSDNLSKQDENANLIESDERSQNVTIGNKSSKDALFYLKFFSDSTGVLAISKS